MTDRLVEKIRSENYLIEIFSSTKDAKYIGITKRIIELVKGIYRCIEPSHFKGKLIVFYDFSNTLSLEFAEGVNYNDCTVLDINSNSLLLQLKASDDLSNTLWTNISDDCIKELLSTKKEFIAYVFEERKEYFMVNNTKITINNQFDCPSIFALQYYYMYEALLDYKNENVRTVSCEHFKKCWNDKKWIYLKNKPEEQMQISLHEFLKNRIRGVDVRREFNLNASKPVDLRVFWREANRAALIELKWLGQSLNNDGEIGTEYTNSRANDGMKQIKEYIDLNNGDGPTVISKGYLVVIDARRKNISKNKIDVISKTNGFHYASEELNIDKDNQYWLSFPNIEKPIRMFVEPVCEM